MAQTTQTATGLPVGNYTVEVTDANNCRVTETVTIGISSGLQDIENNLKISVFPNPTSGMVQVNTIDESIQKLRITVINALGRPILEKTQTGSNGILDLTSLPGGVYTILINTNTSISSQKIIVAK